MRFNFVTAMPSPRYVMTITRVGSLDHERQPACNFSNSRSLQLDQQHPDEHDRFLIRRHCHRFMHAPRAHNRAGSQFGRARDDRTSCIIFLMSQNKFSKVKLGFSILKAYYLEKCWYNFLKTNSPKQTNVIASQLLYFTTRRIHVMPEQLCLLRTSFLLGRNGNRQLRSR